MSTCFFFQFGYVKLYTFEKTIFCERQSAFDKAHFSECVPFDVSKSIFSLNAV